MQIAVNIQHGKGLRDPGHGRNLTPRAADIGSKARSIIHLFTDCSESLESTAYLLLLLLAVESDRCRVLEHLAHEA